MTIRENMLGRGLGYEFIPKTMLFKILSVKEEEGKRSMLCLHYY